MSSTFLRVTAVVLSAGAGVGLGLALHIVKPGLGRWLPDWPATPSATAPSGNATSASSAASPSAAPSASTPPSEGSAIPAASTPLPSASASASQSPASPAEEAACLHVMFAEDSFTSAEPGLAKICEDKSPAKIARRVKELVVNGSGGRLTGGMKEWGMLGIFELAAIAAMRGHCCPGAETLVVPEVGGSCSKLGDSLSAITSASRPGASATDLTAAVARFDQDARCIIRAEQTKAFGDYGPLGGGEGTTLDKTLGRMQQNKTP